MDPMSEYVDFTTSTCRCQFEHTSDQYQPLTILQTSLQRVSAEADSQCIIKQSDGYRSAKIVRPRRLRDPMM